MRRQLKADCLSRSTTKRSVNWSWQLEECSITLNILLVFVFGFFLSIYEHHFDRLSFHCRWVEMISFKRLLQSWWNIPLLFFHRFMSVDASSENNFTAVLCQKVERMKLQHEEDKSKWKRITKRKLSLRFYSPFSSSDRRLKKKKKRNHKTKTW